MNLSADAMADLRVAAVAAGCTVALSLVLRYGLNMSTSPLLRLSPLAVYFGYLFLGKGSTGSAFEDSRLWMLLTAVVTVGVGAYAVA